MQPTEWRHVTITFPDPRTAEDAAVAHLAPILTEAEAQNLIAAWFYVRKGSWRLRYLPTNSAQDADRYINERLTSLTGDGRLLDVVPGVYEPQIHTFGGPEAMDIAHRLWHHDSRHLLSPIGQTMPTRHHELSIVLCAAMMRAAGLDRYEQGEIWAGVASHRDTPRWPRVHTLLPSVERLLTVDVAGLARRGAPLAFANTWVEAYADAGAALHQVKEAGNLRRGLLAILTHHVIFAWNRRSVAGQHQADLATAAMTVIFGPAPTSAEKAESSAT